MKYLFWIVITSALLSFTVVRELSGSNDTPEKNDAISENPSANPENKSGFLNTTLFSAIRPVIIPKDTVPVANGFKQTGNASYYANKFHGRRTSSGIIYHKDSLTAAHKTLKFGTLLKVTNLANDSVVIVKVTDRMGRSPHILDLSYAGAKQLNFVRNGVAKVRIEEIQP